MMTMQDVIRNGTLRLMASESSCDVILSCQGHRLMAHKIILSIASPLLQELLLADQSEISFLLFPDISPATMANILDYIYTGSVLLHSNTLPDFLSVASLLKLRVENTRTSEPKIPAQQPGNYAYNYSNSANFEYKNQVCGPECFKGYNFKNDEIKNCEKRLKFSPIILQDERNPNLRINEKAYFKPKEIYPEQNIDVGFENEFRSGESGFSEDLKEVNGVKKKTARKVPNLMPISRFTAFRTKRGLYNRVFPSPWSQRVSPLVVDPRNEYALRDKPINHIPNGFSPNQDLPKENYEEQNDSNNNFKNLTYTSLTTPQIPQLSETPALNLIYRGEKLLSPNYIDPKHPNPIYTDQKHPNPIYTEQKLPSPIYPDQKLSPHYAEKLPSPIYTEKLPSPIYTEKIPSPIYTDQYERHSYTEINKLPENIGQNFVYPNQNEMVYTSESNSSSCLSDVRIEDEMKKCEEEKDEGEKQKPYKCEECGKQFSQLRNYKYHRSVHEGTKEFAARCPECGKVFNDRGYLSSHLKIHRDRKEYGCPHCPKRFNQRVAYNMHLRIHTGVKPHVCPTCGKSFSRKMLLKQHQRVHTGERPYQCPECGKSFADRSNMSLHARLHTGIKPYACNLCPKSFTKKHHLKTHMNYHTGLKPYVCQKCGLTFSQSSNMRTHYKKCIQKSNTELKSPSQPVHPNALLSNSAVVNNP